MLSWSWAVVYLDTTDKYLFRFDSIKSSTEWRCCLGGQYRSDPRRVLEEFWLHKNEVRRTLHVVLSNQRNLCHLDGTFQSWDIFRLWIFSIDDHFWAYGRVSETGLSYERPFLGLKSPCFCPYRCPRTVIEGRKNINGPERFHKGVINDHIPI